MDTLKIIRLLGIGKFSTVYLVFFPSLSQSIAAVKIINEKHYKDMGWDTKTIQNEISALQLEIPFAPRLYEWSYDQGIYHLTMEYLDGITFDKYITTIPDLNDVINITRQLLTGLYEIHAQGINHGDITELNIMVNNDLTIKYIDFGSSILLEEDNQSQDVYCLGMVLKKLSMTIQPHYMLPFEYLSIVGIMNILDAVSLDEIIERFEENVRWPK